MQRKPKNLKPMKAKSISQWAIALLFSVFLFGIWGVLLTGLACITCYYVKGSDLSGALLAVVAYGPCTDTTSTFTKPGDCIEEGTGIIGFLRIKRGFDISGIADDTAYAAAKTAKDIEVVAGIEAFWPQTDQVTSPGRQGRMPRHNKWTYNLPFTHEGVYSNLKFWNTWNSKTDYGLAFITEDYRAIACLDRDLEPILVAMAARPVGEQEFGKILTVQGTVQWQCKDLVYHLDNLTTAILKPDFQV